MEDADPEVFFRVFLFFREFSTEQLKFCGLSYLKSIKQIKRFT